MFQSHQYQDTSQLQIGREIWICLQAKKNSRSYPSHRERSGMPHSKKKHGSNWYIKES